MVELPSALAPSPPLGRTTGPAENPACRDPGGVGKSGALTGFIPTIASAASESPGDAGFSTSGAAGRSTEGAGAWRFEGAGRKVRRGALGSAPRFRSLPVTPAVTAGASGSRLGSDARGFAPGGG